MVEFIFPILFGCAFVWLGRWMYRNPKKVYPNWAYSNPDHPTLIRFVRLFATLVIFGGSFAAIAAVSSKLLPEAAQFIIPFAGAICAAWFGRPRLQLMSSSPASPDGHHQSTPGRSFLSKKGKWVVAIGCCAAIILFVGVFAWIGNSEVCQVVVQKAQASEAVGDRLGQPIKRGLFVSGSIEVTGPSGHADIAIPLSGSKGKGTLYAVGTKSAGTWKFETLQLAIDGSPNRIDLLANTAPGKVLPQ